MMKRVHCEKKTKIYIPKTLNPQIISYRQPAEIGTQSQGGYMQASTINADGLKQQ